MNNGTIDLIILILIFIGLQFWWIIPIIKNSNRINKLNSESEDLVNILERIYKK